MKSALATSAVLVVLLAATPALAEEASPASDSAGSLTAAAYMEPEEEVSARVKPYKPLRVGVQLELLPVGAIGFTPKYGEVETRTDTTATFAVTARLDYDIAPHIRVGAAPRLILAVEREGGEAVGREVDLRARGTVHGKLGRMVELHGFLSPGFATSIPEDSDVKKAQGFIFGAGVGANLVLSEAFYLNTELAYQWGFQRQGGAYLTTDFLSLAVGAGTRF